VGEAYSEIKKIAKENAGHDLLLSQASMALAQMGLMRRARNIANECSAPDMRLDAYTVILAEFTKQKHQMLAGAINAIVLTPPRFTPAKP